MSKALNVILDEEIDRWLHAYGTERGLSRSAAVRELLTIALQQPLTEEQEARWREGYDGAVQAVKEEVKNVVDDLSMIVQS